MDSPDTPLKKTENNHIVRKDSENLIVDAKTHGLFNVRALIFLLLWYIFSGCTLFLNKYILTFMNGNPTVLGEWDCLAFSARYCFDLTIIVCSNRCVSNANDSNMRIYSDVFPLWDV